MKPKILMYFQTCISVPLNDLHDTTCMTHNRFSNFQCVYTITQIVHTEFLQSIQPSRVLSKMSQKHAAVAVIIAVISEKNKSSKKKKKKKSLYVKPWLKRRKKLRIL